MTTPEEPRPQGKNKPLATRAFTRSVKLATLPMGLAGRTAIGLGKRTVGKPAEMVLLEIQERTAEQLFQVLGELKGGAMKIGQAMSMYEAALPPELAGSYRAALTKLQEAAPPLPVNVMHGVLAESLGENWRDYFLEFDDKPAASASIGQVHKAVWNDGRTVAVKLQYPGIAKAIASDLRQAKRLSKLFATLVPGADLKGLLGELEERIHEELDYELEAGYQTRFRQGFADDADFYVPEVVAQAGTVLITEWVDGTQLSKIIENGTQEERNRVGMQLFRFNFSSPSRCGLIQCDPHPGNYRVMSDGRLAVLDFGACGEIDEAMVAQMTDILRNAVFGSDEDWVIGAREHGFLVSDSDVDVQLARELLQPLHDALSVETFRFDREFMRQQGMRSLKYSTDLRVYKEMRKVNLPSQWVQLGRMLSGAAVLCQLECEGPFRAEIMKWLPGFATEQDFELLTP